MTQLCPEGVEFRPLRDCVQRNVGGGTPSRSRSEFWDGEIPWASVGDITACGLKLTKTRQTITQLGLEKSSSNLIPAGYVVVAVKISPGAMRVAESDVAINQDLRGLLLREELDPYFLTYYFQTVNLIGNGTIVKGITNATLGQVRVPVPPIEIQREIVRILDQFTELQTKLEAELELRRRQFEHYQAQLLSLRTDESHQVRLLPLGDIGRVSMCKRVFKEETSPEGDIPFYKIGTFGGVPDSYISKQLFDDYRARYSFPKPGDILISAAGTIGRAVAYDGQPAYFQDSNIVWIDNDERVVSNAYLRYWYRVIKWATDGGTIKRLYNENIRRALIAVPPLDEQARIVDKLDRFEALMNDPHAGISAELRARRQQYEHYRDTLLTFKEVPA